jgi:hypothetical protein
MNRITRWMRGRRAGALLICAALVACNDDRGPDRIGAPLARAARNATASPSSLPASAVSFDATIEALASESARTRTTQFHVDRVRSGATGWRTTIHLISTQPEGWPNSRRAIPASLEIDETGVATLRLSDGSIASTPNPTTLPGADRVSPPNAAAAATLADALAHNRIGRAEWIDAMVRSTSDCDRESAAVRAGQQPDQRDANGDEHFIKHHNASTVDAVLDHVHGRLIGMVGTDGTRSATVTSDYADGPPGVTIRRQFKVVSTNGNKHRSTTITLAKVNIDGREVVP